MTVEDRQTAPSQTERAVDESIWSAARRMRRQALRERRWTTRTLWGGVAIVLLVPAAALVVSIFGLLPGPNQTNLGEVFQPPSVEHPFGTDQLGRDLLSRVLSATWLDYQVALTLTFVPMATGMVVGAVAGYFGGPLDTLIMRVTDVMMAFPFFVLVVAIIAAIGPGLTGVYVALLATGWAFSARLTRGEMLVLRESQYMSAARTLGLPTRRILFVHAFPNVLVPNLVASVSTVVTTILGIATLSYLGLGVQPPTPEWGAIIAEGQQYMFTHWWMATLPGLVLVLVGLGFSMLGDGVAERLDIDYEVNRT